MRYALRGHHSGQFLTQGGLIITHTDRAELEWLYRGSFTVVSCDAPETECLPVQFAIGMEHIRFPLRKGDFR